MPQRQVQTGMGNSPKHAARTLGLGDAADKEVAPVKVTVLELRRLLCHRQRQHCLWVTNVHLLPDKGS